MCRVLNEDGWKIMDDGDFLFCLQISFSVSPTPTLRQLWISEYSYLLIHTYIGMGDKCAILDFSQRHLTGNSWTYLRNFWYVMAFGLTMPKWYNTYVLQIFFKNIFSKNCKNIFDQIFTKKI